MKRWTVLAAAFTALTSSAGAQQYQRRATIVGGGDPEHGKCTIQVVIDDVAEIEIRGDQGTLRNLSGQPAEWRLFECTSAIPPTATNFEFEGVDDRGSQELARDPSRGGAAVIRIDDPEGGSEGYIFDVTWDGGFDLDSAGNIKTPVTPGPRGHFTAEQATKVCQTAVRERARTRFHGRTVDFRETRMEDDPDRNDWVVGMIDVSPGPGTPAKQMRFSCSVNFDNGQVRSMEVDPVRTPGSVGSAAREVTPRAFDNCQVAVRPRVLPEGEGRVDFTSIRMDDTPGRKDWVTGTVRADSGDGFEAFNFSCSVDMRGEVRSVDVTKR